MEQPWTESPGGAVNHLTFWRESRSLRACAGALVVLLTLTSVGSSEPVRKSGYAIGTETCGSADLAFPRIQIDMKAGFCAGLVASEEDRLKFPRSIIQVPGRDLFVVADMAGWGHTDGRLLLLDPRAPQGQRFKELLTAIEYPFGLVIGPDKKLYASSAETIFRFDPLADIRGARSRPSSVICPAAGSHCPTAPGSTTARTRSSSLCS